MLGLICGSCKEEWDNHYNETQVISPDTDIYAGDIVSYIRSEKDLSLINAVFESSKSYDNIKKEKGYTIIVYKNNALQLSHDYDNKEFADYCICDLSVSPSSLKDGYGIQTRLGKNIWVSKSGDEITIENKRIEKKVKTDNGYVYYLEDIMPVKKSVYEFLNSLGEEYSLFVSYVKEFEEEYFDEQNSIPTGVDEMGNTIYADSIIDTRNTLMDRYTENGLLQWNMRSEDFLSTMFVPSNDLIKKAISNALDSIPSWLGRESTESDIIKFKEWIVKACFVENRLYQNDVAGDKDINCVGGYLRQIDKTQDSENFEKADPALWRTSIQKLNVSNPVALSNGNAYYVNEFKIPNHVVIYRVKAKFYELWGAMSDSQKNQYFRWENWVDPLIINDAQGPFTLSETLPTMYYHVLTAIPGEEAIKDSMPCSVTYDGVIYNSATKKLKEVYLPAGEYNLRMGFKHSLTYSISIYFNDKLIVEDMVLYAQGSNFHFDRGSVSDMDYFGNISIGYGEGFNWKEWIEKDEKAVAYDTDGYQVAVVNIPESGNFTITITSNDMCYLYDAEAVRNKNNVTQLMMYHWCLRPTRNNY